MKKGTFFSACLVFLLLGFSIADAKEDVTVVAPTSEAAEGLDLQAVGELFKYSQNIEQFEKSLNASESGINNLDLDDNGEVDFIRVVEESADDTRLIILQVPIGQDEFQDVATIEVEKTGEADYNMQLHGNEVLYGSAYYVTPVSVEIRTWPIIAWIYGPGYRPYQSAFYFGVYPKWWRPYHPVAFTVYHAKTLRIVGKTFAVARAGVVGSITKLKYKPRSSTLVIKKTTVVKTKGGKTTVKKTTVKQKRNR